MNKIILQVNVRNLVEFVLQEGNIDVSWQKHRKALDGIRGHNLARLDRPETYQKEVKCEYTYETATACLKVAGRMDGLFAAADGYTVEEIKTVAGDVLNYSTVHLGQAKVYAVIFAMNNRLEHISVCLNYYCEKTNISTFFNFSYCLAELESFFEQLCLSYLDFALKRHEWVEKRQENLQNLVFPYEKYRSGQRELAVNVYHCLTKNYPLFAQAATGIGKTQAVIFPALKALRPEEKIFYLTAKTVGSKQALKALMHNRDLQLKVIVLTAKQKICFQEKVDCRPEFCPYARNYFGKLKKARFELFSYNYFQRETIEIIAQKYRLCPFELSLELSLWCDFIICDYNYVFDPKVFLRRFFEDNDHILLVDEAHNLPERAKSMYSAELKLNELKAFLPLLPKRSRLKKDFTALINLFREMKKQIKRQGYLQSDKKHKELLTIIHGFSKLLENYFDTQSGFTGDAALLELYFSLLDFLRIADYFGKNYIFLWEIQPFNDISATFLCLDASLYISERALKLKSVFFSATLTPFPFFERVILGKYDYPCLLIPSHFPPENRLLLINNNLSTIYKKRDDNYPLIAALLRTFICSQRGNKLIFFPSFEYLEAILPYFKDDALLIQDKNLTEEKKDSFLEELACSDNLTGFAVLGGIFAEGIDLDGKKLIAVAIVGVGLPKLSVRQEILRAYYERLEGEGFNFAYLYPGFNKITQALGRLIRHENERGIALLIDERYTHPRYLELFPEDWYPYKTVHSSPDLEKRINFFWNILPPG